MTEVKTIDVSHLTPYAISTQSPVWWGQVLLAAIEGTMFFIVMGAYFYVRLRMDVWPPPGDQFPHTLLPTLALIPLVLSCAGSYWASEGAKKNSRRDMIGGMVLNLLLVAAFFIMRLVEWHSLNFSYKSDAFGTYVWTFLALHSFDVVADTIYTMVLLVLFLMGRDGPKQRIGVHVDSVVWYFLVAIWIPIYVVVYWGPRFLETQQ